MFIFEHADLTDKNFNLQISFIVYELLRRLIFFNTIYTIHLFLYNFIKNI